MKKNKLLVFFAPEKAFLLFGMLFGLLFVFITPPFQVPDEINHFYRSYQISEGHIRAIKIRDSVGDFLPESLKITTERVLKGNTPFVVCTQNIKDLLSLSSIPLNRKKKVFIDFHGQVPYPPVSYLPQAVGIGIGKIFDLPPIVLFYLGRICNLSAWILLVYFSIKIIPLSKWVFFLLALTPMSVYLAASLSADCATNGLAFLLIALIFRYAIDENSIVGNKGFLTLILLFVLMSLTKQAYFFLVLLYLLIPCKKINTEKKYFINFIILVSVSLGIVMLWAFCMKDLYVPARAESTPHEQVLFILSHPLKYMGIFVSTIFSKNYYIREFIGQLGWLSIGLPKVIRISYPAVLLIASIVCSSDKIIHLKQRILIFLIFLFNVVVVFTSVYIVWTPLASDKIIGIQGRHLIPIAPLFFLLFCNRKIQIKERFIPHCNVFLMIFSIFTLTYTLMTLLKRYY